MLFFALIILLLITFFYYKAVKPTKFWEERDVPHAKSWPLLGSLKDWFWKKKHLTEILIDIYNQHPNERCVGYMQFTIPFLMIRDLDLIKRITVKDFDHFQDHLAFDNIKTDPLLSKSLISLRGETWRRMRATLSPVFTSSKMRIIYDLITECAENFARYFQGKERMTFEMKDLFSRFANDVIATTAFGVKIDSVNDPKDEFYQMGKKFTSYGFAMVLKIIFLYISPGLVNFLRIEIFGHDVNVFFRSLVRENIRKRLEEGIVRPDLIHLLMEVRKDHDENHETTELTDDHIVAQALLFFFAGFESVSTGSSFVAHELALNPEIQIKLHQEIDSVYKEHSGKVPYEALLSMKYLNQVICETLRLWPPAFHTDRLCVKDYVIEPILPKEKVVFVPKGTSVAIPVMAIQRDPRFFADPDKFDPERFSDENKANIVPGTYLPFGLGPRNCIGSRFALLEIKILFFHLLSNFIIVPVEETAIPLRISPKRIDMAPENGFRLCLKPRIKK